MVDKMQVTPKNCMNIIPVHKVFTFSMNLNK